MSLGVLNNLNAIYAANNLNNTSNSLSTVLQQLSSGSRINSGADDAAGLSLVDGLQANSTALTQSVTNATEGVGLLKVADGALSQVTNLLNRAVTLATESSNGTLNTSQLAAANQEYQSILAEISNIGSTTTYNGNKVFSGTAVNIYTGDSTSTGASTDALTIDTLSNANLGDTGGAISYASSTISYTATAGQNLSATNLTSQTNAQTALTDLNTAITDVAAQDGYVGSQINTLNSVSQVLGTQQQNIAAAQNAVQATDYAQATSNLSKYEILSQTGISALAQANSLQQEVTKLLQ
ncbi:MAG: flagellin [Acidobacteriota bacterium]|nr:flagellin [Acidobacteriota bacterium]